MNHLRALVLLAVLANSMPVHGLELVCSALGRATAIDACCCLPQHVEQASALDNFSECCCQLRVAIRSVDDDAPADRPVPRSIAPDLGRVQMALSMEVAATDSHRGGLAPQPLARSAPLFLQHRSLLI